MLFGLLSFLMDIFKIATYVGYLHCDSPVKVAYPIVQAVFLFFQVVACYENCKNIRALACCIGKTFKSCLF